jgi:hypothetical protein
MVLLGFSREAALPHSKDTPSSRHIPAWVTPLGIFIHPHMHPIGR